ncbi:hypothetical protein B0J11DRAFT_326277 [Dendryphion nanum]|uniref:Uncharacterized protein n=1 Tax=Dendryphion nanum TaxID=256645 RepID=A0A9P9ILS4_9PLEO|nr:hypothetical protein B0J11DRAFT_326277 [Dendryphion nanum]
MSRPGVVEDAGNAAVGVQHDQRQPAKENTRDGPKVPDEHEHEPQKPERDEEQAAQLIQRNYRGYRTRRQLQGMGLDASARWAEAVKEAKWRNATRPLSRSERSQQLPAQSPEERSRAGSEAARRQWKRVGEIARRAGGDDPADPSTDEDEMSSEERREHRRKKAQLKVEREKTAKMMDLQYFLEMVDGEHYVNHDLDKAKGLSKIKYVSAAAVLNHLLRGSVKPNSWIFVSVF